MLKISHRGNTNGPSIDENKPHKVMEVIYSGYDCEVDLWFTREGLFLGHDKPTYKIDYHFLVNKHLWVHCKNYDAFVNLSNDPHIHLFWHTDGIALTTKGYLWTAPGLIVGDKSIAVMPELNKGWNYPKAFDVCTDYL